MYLPYLRLSSFALAGALATVAAGCTPDSRYRYTGLTPAAHALAWDGRTARDGTLRVEGSMAVTPVNRNVDPHEHDTALRVPNSTLEGAATLAPIDGLELGVRYAWSAYSWSEPSATGTLPLPSRPSVWGIGPEVRAMIPFDKQRRFTVGIAGSFMRYEVPYAEWVRVPTCVESTTCVYDPTTSLGSYYRLNDEKSESHLALNVAIYPSVALGDDEELGHVFAGFALHTGFKNDGFTEKATNGSTIQDAGLVTIAGLGYGVRLFDAFRASGMITLPLTSHSSAVDYRIGGFLTVGVDIELWESRAEKRRREREEAERHAREAGPR